MCSSSWQSAGTKLITFIVIINDSSIFLVNCIIKGYLYVSAKGSFTYGIPPPLGNGRNPPMTDRVQFKFIFRIFRPYSDHRRSSI